MAQNNKYKDTLNLPQTDFPMRGNLAVREPETLKKWQDANVYEQIQQARKDAPTFVLHDGPPYSNGHIHYGHILNKVLKDLVVKYKVMTGYRSPYIPGWDTHGLPIELAVDKELKEKKRDMPLSEFREKCADYAKQYVDIQRDEFMRLGVFGDWQKPYLTLQHNYEASIVKALAAFARQGFLYRQEKPVYWSPGAQSALAESEIEYKEHTSPSIYVRFPMADDFEAKSLAPKLAGKKVALVIWTTTPWTLPANLAVVLHPNFEYVAVPSPKESEEYLLVAKELLPTVAKAIDLPEDTEAISVETRALSSLEGMRYQHPFVEPKQEQDHRVWFADYVTLEQGTGLVHTAPGHGADDYITGRKHDLEPYAPVNEYGKFTEDVAPWAGQNVFKANPAIVESLHNTGYLLNKPGETITHSYPHCWRTKGPIIFRATPQWFMRIDHNEFRERALAEIKATKWIPEWSENRIDAMVGGRPDWCLSRQRTWGVPIPVFYCEDCDEALADAEVMDHIAQIFETSGADAWYTMSAAELLPSNTKCNCGNGPDKMTKGQDIVDVWFESGCSWLAMKQAPFELPDIDLYLEGSDQHRGWFHSSLLVALGVLGRAPYKQVLTHGFVLDENGHPYSKSAIAEAKRQGKKIKYIDPQDLVAKQGAELLRMWVGSTDFRTDIPYSETILKGLSDWYRKFRNSMRFMLGNLAGFDPTRNSVDSVNLSALDTYALARLGDLIHRVRAAYEEYEFHQVHRRLVEYVTIELSAQYLDVVKDTLYADSQNGDQRLAIQTVLYEVTRALCLVAAPIMAFTSQEIWEHLPKREGDPEFVHLCQMPQGKASEQDPAWQKALEYRELVFKELEAFRAQKHKSVDAHITLTLPKQDLDALAPITGLLPDFFIVSALELEAGETHVTIKQHPGEKCARCWKWFDSLSEATTDVCVRCAEALNALENT